MTAVMEENKGLVLSYEEEDEAIEDSPTSYLRHLKEISYILEKLRSNRARFLLAAAHRRRRQLGSFAAKQKYDAENFCLSDSAGAGQDGETLGEETSLRQQYLLRQHQQFYQQQEHEQQEFEQQGHISQEKISLDVQLFSETRSISPGSDVPSRPPGSADGHCEAEVSSCAQLPAQATAATTMPNAEAAVTDVCKRDPLDSDANTAAAASDAADDRGRLPAATAVNRWEALESSTIKASVIAARTPSHGLGSFPTRRESILQRAPVTEEGDDLDLYLGELLVPLLHDGLVKLCRLVELKQSDKSKQRLGTAFHEHFNPLRWLGQYLMRHHPKNGEAQVEETNRFRASELSSESPSNRHHEEPVHTEEQLGMDQADRAVTLANTDDTTATAGAKAERPPQATTPTGIAGASHGSVSCHETDTLEAASTKTAGMSATGADAASADDTARAAHQQRTSVARKGLPVGATESESAAAAASDGMVDAQGSAEVKGQVALAALQGLSTSCSHRVDSLHKRRMQQYASFYGVLKDIVDQERIRRDFLLRREEVKHIFEVFCQEKSKSQLEQDSLGCNSGSCLSQASAEWGRRLSQSLRRKSSVVTDRTLSFACGNSSATGSPRQCTTATEERPTSVRAATTTMAVDGAGAADDAAGDALHPVWIEKGHAVPRTGAVVETPAGDADGTIAGAPAPARINVGGMTSSETSQGARKSEEETVRGASPRTAGQLAATGPAEPTKLGEALAYLPVCVEDFQDILEKLDAHWGLEGRFLDVFQRGLPIPIATEHADLIQYVLPQHQGELVIEDPEDVQPDEFWEFVKYYTEVHNWIRRELYNKRKRQLHVTAGTTNQQNLVDLLVKKKMVVLQQRDDNEDDVSKTELPEKE